jgi:hypothetical protein
MHAGSPSTAIRGTQRSRHAANLRIMDPHARSSARNTSTAHVDSTMNRCSTPQACRVHPDPTHCARREIELSAAAQPREQTDSACATVIPAESPSPAALGQHSMIRVIWPDRVV